MKLDIETLPVRNNEEDGQFEIEIDGQVALLAYFRRGDSIIYPHTLVPEELEGHGLAGRLARHALEYAREHHLTVVPRCPYVRAYLREHPEYADLVEPGSQSEN